MQAAAAALLAWYLVLSAGVCHLCSMPSPTQAHHISTSNTSPSGDPEDVLLPVLVPETGVAARHHKAIARQDCLLLWQISELDYLCGNVEIDLSELVDTINCLYGCIADNGQTAVEDALLDEAGLSMQHDC